MKVVVFGGSGFVGSHLADAFSEAGHDVRIFDVKPSPYLREDQEMVVGDLLNLDEVLVAVQGFDVVCNFAGIADLDDARTRPADTVYQNVLGTVHVLEAARLAEVRRYMHASTVYVYSDRGGFYRCSKQAAELYVEEYQKHYGLDFTILRFGSLFGTRSDERNSIWKYLNQAIKQKRISCSGTGEEIREYINVRDAARLCVDVLSDEFRNEHVIITGANPMRFRQLLEMINEILGGGVELEFSESEDGGHYRFIPYTFEPKIGYKLTSNKYLDMGQGLLECLREIHANNSKDVEYPQPPDAFSWKNNS